MKRFTILGASGLVGSHLINFLNNQGFECFAPDRGDASLYRQELGHVIDCIGVTADFRERPLETVRAHACRLVDDLAKYHFESFLYLSSTRVYLGSDSGEEDTALQVQPQRFEDLYNLSKLMGESLCFSFARPAIRVARLSNIYAPDFSDPGFLSNLVRDALRQKEVALLSDLDSEKDYVNLEDVVRVLPEIAQHGRYRLYNVASGENTSHRVILSELKKSLDFSWKILEGVPKLAFPILSIERVRKEFGFVPTRLLESLSLMLQGIKAGGKQL